MNVSTGYEIGKQRMNGSKKWYDCWLLDTSWDKDFVK